MRIFNCGDPFDLYNGQLNPEVQQLFIHSTLHFRILCLRTINLYIIMIGIALIIITNDIIEKMEFASLLQSGKFSVTTGMSAGFSSGTIGLPKFASSQGQAIPSPRCFRRRQAGRTFGRHGPFRYI